MCVGVRFECVIEQYLKISVSVMAVFIRYLMEETDYFEGARLVDAEKQYCVKHVSKPWWKSLHSFGREYR
jgi:ABC-type cobalt transport system substrate-binding protein